MAKEKEGSPGINEVITNTRSVRSPGWKRGSAECRLLKKTHPSMCVTVKDKKGNDSVYGHFTL